MAASTLPRCLALVLLLCVSVTLAGPVTTSTATTLSPSGDDTTADVVPDDASDTTGDDAAATETDDVTEEAMKLIKDIRQFAVVAKKGMALSSISEGAEKLKERAEELLQELPDNADRCETNSVIKMAAARIASAEILALLQAEDQTDVLHGRLAMSFGFLESVAQMIEDELALSTNIGGELAALVFGADITDSIAETSDALVRASASNNEKSDVKRQWSVGVQPSFTPQGGLGVNGNLDWKSKNGRTGVSVNPSWSQGGGWRASGSYDWKSKNGRTSVNVSPSWSKGSGFGVSAGLKYTFGK